MKWKYQHTGSSTRGVHWISEDPPDRAGRHIATVFTGKEHDARLIAAAPDLLEAVEDLLTYIGVFAADDETGVTVRARGIAAVIKARGEA
jgi:hypothetical protein